MSRKNVFLALTAAMALTCTGCSGISSDISGKTYVYENGGFADIGEFGITLNDDGTSSYYEGWASSYVGYGNWEIENGGAYSFGQRI